MQGFRAAGPRRPAATGALETVRRGANDPEQDRQTSQAFMEGKIRRCGRRARAGPSLPRGQALDLRTRRLHHTVRHRNPAHAARQTRGERGVSLNQPAVHRTRRAARAVSGGRGEAHPVFGPPAADQKHPVTRRLSSPEVIDAARYRRCGVAGRGARRATRSGCGSPAWRPCRARNRPVFHRRRGRER